MSKTRVHEFLRWLLSASLFLSFAVFTVFTNSPVSATDAPSASWTVDSAYSSSSSLASQVVGTNAVIKFHLANPNSSNVFLLSQGVGAVDSSTHTSGFVDGPKSPVLFPTTNYYLTGNSESENVESISISSSVAGTQTLVANVFDPTTGAPTSTKTFTITWFVLPTSGIHLTYKKGDIGVPSNITSVTSINGAQLYPSNKDYQSQTMGDGDFLISGINPGTYRIRVDSSDGTNNGLSENCVVTTDAITNCSIALGDGNFPFKITNTLHNALDSSAGIFIRTSRLTPEIKGIASYSWDISDISSAGTAMSLGDGAYLLSIYSNGSPEIAKAKNVATSNTDFNITISGGVVSSIKSAATNTDIPIDHDSGKYILQTQAANFNAKVLAGDRPIIYQWVAINTRDPITNNSTSSNTSTDGNGTIHTNLPNGINTLYIYNFGADSTEYINTFYFVVVENGLVTSVVNSQQTPVSKDPDLYPLSLTPANVKGTFTIGGIAQQGYISEVFDLATKQYISFEASYINNAGKYGIRLPVGNYRVLVQPNSGISVPITCKVTTDAMQTCDATGSNKNFKIEIDDKSGNPITNGNAYAFLGSTIYSDANRTDTRNDYLDYRSDNNLFYAADGIYTIEIHSRDENTDGSTRTYSFGVSGGVVSNVTDSLNGQVATVDAGGVIHLKLLSPNFFAHISANGNPDPGANVSSFQPGKNNNQYRNANADSSGIVKLNLPDGLNSVTINPTSIETPTVVAATYSVQVSGGIVQSVARDTGETLAVGTDTTYTLDFSVPNIVGTLSVNGSPTNGRIWRAWNTVLNRDVPFSQSGIDQNGNYAVLVPAGNYDFMFVSSANGNVGGVQNCTATAGVKTRCDVSFPADNLTINLQNGAGSLLTSGTYAYINRQSTGGQSFAGWWNFNLPLNASGQFHTSLLDGKYTLNIGSTSPITDGVGRAFTFSVSSGVASTLEDMASGETVTATASVFTVPLLTPNLKAIVKANGSPDQFVWYYGGGSTNAKQGIYSSFSRNTDANGALAERLPDGNYNLQLVARGSESPAVVNNSYDFTIESGAVASFIDSDGNAVTQNDGFYQLSLKVPNVVGTITVAGQPATDKLISIQGVYSLESQRWVNFQTVGNQWLHESYALGVKSGNYLIAVTEYGKGTIFVPCLVAATGTTTCNLAIPDNNFKFKVQATDGTDLFDNVGANGTLQLQNTGAGFWLQIGTGGLFTSPLQIPTGTSGYYQITVYPTDGSSRHGVATTYKVEMASDGVSVATVTNQDTGATVTPDGSGVYGLKLTGSNITGTVVTQDGTTPVPNSQVCAQGPLYGLCFYTDNSGAFAARTNIDGTYQVFAQPPTFDMTKADSARSPVVVTGDSSSPGSVTLQLRTPNVIGVVHGPDGVTISPSNYLQIMKDDGGGNFNYVGWDVAMGRPTDGSGHFAFHLDPGRYKFQAQVDDANAHGSATVSPVCEVLNNTDTYNCTFNLSSSNVKLQVLGQGAKAYTEAYVYYNFMGDKNNSDYRPSKYWDYGNLDKFGQTKTFLENGTWNVSIYPYGSGSEAPLNLVMTVEAGAVTSVVDSNGNPITAAADGYFQIQLPTSNLTGTISSGGKKIDYWSNVYVLQDKGNYYEWVRGQGFGSGKFSFLVSPGTYVVQVIPYPNTAFSSGTPVSTKFMNCVVPESGAVTCDVALQTGNLLGKITTPSGAPTSDTYAWINKVNTDASQKSVDWLDTQMSVNNGQFSVHLDTGEYNLVVNPGWNTSSGFTPRTYKILVNTDATPVITSITDLTSNVPLSIDSHGWYGFPLSVAAITGKVFKSGGSTQTIPYAQIIAVDPVSGEELWQYSTQANYQGQYSLSLPDGTYRLKAKTWGWYGEGVSTSESQTVTVADEILTSGGPNPINFHMQDPNFTIKVVAPGTTTGISNVYVNGNFNNQYFGGVTDGLGNFSAFVDTSTATTCNVGATCQITIYPNNNPKYSQASYTLSSIDGVVRNYEIGQVTSHLTIRIPTNGGTGLPDKWSWATVDELANETNTVITRTGYGANELGQIGLGLITGHHYSITAYPSGDYYDRYSPKTLAIPNFDPSDANQVSPVITFDSPNITFIVTDRNGGGNAWGWFEVSKKNESGGFDSYNYGYLNDQGRGAQYLPNGDYQVVFYPGKAIGVTKTITFTVTGGHIAGTPAAIGVTFAGDVGRVVLGNGNVTGTVSTASGSLLANIPVTAKVVGVETTTVSTVTKADGSYELNLDTSKSWQITALNPLTAETSTPLGITLGFTTLVEAIKFDS